MVAKLYLNVKLDLDSLVGVHETRLTLRTRFFDNVNDARPLNFGMKLTKFW